MKDRRCIVCLGFLADHTPSRLAARGYREHRFDPGERRSGRERVARRVVWTNAERRRRTAA